MCVLHLMRVLCSLCLRRQEEASVPAALTAHPLRRLQQHPLPHLLPCTPLHLMTLTRLPAATLPMLPELTAAVVSGLSLGARRWSK